MRLNQRTVYKNSIPLDSEEVFYRTDYRKKSNSKNETKYFAIQKTDAKKHYRYSKDVIFDTVELTEDIIDNSSKDPFDLAVQTKLKETTTKILSSLTPREERVIRMRFGIGMNSDHTLQEVGQQLGVCRHRIAQIEAKALGKLKDPTRTKLLRSFLERNEK